MSTEVTRSENTNSALSKALAAGMQDDPRQAERLISPELEALRAQFAPALRTRTHHVLSRPSLSFWQDAWMRLRSNGQAFTSLILIVFMLLFTLAGPSLWTIDPSAQDMSRISERPTFSKTAVVLGEIEPYQEVVLPESAQKTEVAAADLTAPQNLSLMAEPTTQSVRLKWDAVPGATSYAIYRGETQATDQHDLGVPIAEVEGGNHVSYEDSFNLEHRPYYYAVAAKIGGEEGSKFATIEVNVPSSISLADAQLTMPDAKVGDVVQLVAHPMGTDYLGRDLLARLMAGARISLFIGFVAPLLATIIGVLLGGIAGLAGGRTDQVLMRFTDFVLALPFLLFMILFKVVFGAGAGESGVSAMLLAMVLLSWTGPARLARGQILQLREAEFVQASRLLGAGNLYILLKHMIPNTLGVLLVSLTFAIPSAIFTEAFLSFIGMGVVPPTPSWGSMSNDGIQTFLVHPHEFLFPALFISVTVLAFNLLGDGLRDALDPKLRATK